MDKREDKQSLFERILKGSKIDETLKNECLNCIDELRNEKMKNE